MCGSMYEFSDSTNTDYITNLSDAELGKVNVRARPAGILNSLESTLRRAKIDLGFPRNLN